MYAQTKELSRNNLPVPNKKKGSYFYEEEVINSSVVFGSGRPDVVWSVDGIGG